MLLTTMETAVSLDFKQISFESDSRSLMLAFNEGSCVSNFHGILLDIKALAMAFESVVFLWVSRDNVSHVDVVAKHVLKEYIMNPF